MPVLNGHPSLGPVLIPTTMGSPAGGIPIGGPTTGPRGGQPGTIIIDGTPIRVVVYALAAAAGLVALRMAGFKFNVGVSA